MIKHFTLTKMKLLTAVGLLAILFSLWLIPGPARKGAMVRVEPNQHQVQQGYEWQAKVLVDSNMLVNALDIVVAYPSDEVQVVDMALDDTRFETKIFEPTHDEGKHEIYFVQATLEPFEGQNGQVGTITFKAKKPAHPHIIANQDSKIIAHDGEGTNVYQLRLSRSVGEWLIDLVRGKG